MTEKENGVPQDNTPGGPRQLVLMLIIGAAALIWSINNPSTALRVLAVLLGFGGIVFIHELGHFLVAKLGGIKVEAFSLGFPPVLLGIRKLKKGWRFRLLPKIGEAQQILEGDNETEYQIGMFPVGGFVKMLGQSDTGSADATQDPRSFSNRPVWIRIATVSAGVIFNAIGAVVIFMVLFMNGIDLKPAVVGEVVRNSPAYHAGFRPGDEIVEINGERFVDFEAVLLSPALSGPGEPISFVIRRPEGTEQQLRVVAEKRVGDATNLRFTGISPAETLTVEPMIAKDPNTVQWLFKESGLRPGDQVRAVNGRAVQTPWDFRRIQEQIFQPKIQLTVSRKWPVTEEQSTLVNVDFPTKVGPIVENFRDEHDLAHFSSMVPRLYVESYAEPRSVASLPRRVASWFQQKILRSQPTVSQNGSPRLMPGDIIIKIADQDYPTYRHLRELTTQYRNRDLPVTILRKDEHGVEQPLEVTVQPRTEPGKERVVMGIALRLDMDSPIVARTIADQAGTTAAVPSGATITAVNGQSVASFFEIASILQNAAGQTVAVDYRLGDTSGSASLAVSEYQPVHAQSIIQTVLPFADLTREFKASNPVEAVRMGFKKAWHFVWRSYITLGRLFQRTVPVTALSGPVGIVSMTYQVTGTSISHYLYFLGLISSSLAVMNLLPLPVLDGGHIVILLIERLSGRPINERILAGVMYAGMAFLLGIFVWITYNDLVRVFFG